ncbi:hypothetical protein RN001_014389 [Aquatica leii]|uniref:Uncharacterized protein n=1 Tax=Aquatica leii TaxID=1421715 RepID=A0AAN7PYG9_9COLE|nr:hypothetical protein RN001_014389 [Aquatica leii]
MLQKAYNFITYWYFRYLLITELYMVEKWERHMFHIVLVIIFSLISLFNWTVTLSLVGYAVDNVKLNNFSLQMLGAVYS